MRAHGAEQGRLEPSAVLVAAFEVEVAGPRVFGLGRYESEIAGTGFEPDVEDVSFFFELCARAVRAPGSDRNDVVGLVREPRVGALTGEELDHALVDRRVVERLATTFTEEHCDRDAPDALA